MLIAEILKSKGGAVFSISPEASLGVACAELERRRVGALVVCDGDHVVGVLSERDVVRAAAVHGGEGLERPVSDYMTARVVFAGPGETVEALLERMTDRRIRHLPVMSDGRLLGLVSIGDLVKQKIADATHEAEALRTYIAAG